MSQRTEAHGTVSRLGSRRSVLSLALFGALAGLLLYGKLRVATAVPRSAYAVPNEFEIPEADGVPGHGVAPEAGSQAGAADDVAQPARPGNTTEAE